MNLNTVHTIAEISSSVVVGIAAIVGGFWALHRFRRERSDEAAIEIGLNSTCVPYDAAHLIFFDVVLTNVGKIRVEAKREHKNRLAFDDGVEKLQHSGSLQLKRLQSWKEQTNRYLDWFENELLGPVLGLDEINLLTPYEDPKEGNVPDFWMEPGEVYHLGAAVVLPPGLYIAKITFVAADEHRCLARLAGWLKRNIRKQAVKLGMDKSDSNFWTRLSLVQVPEQKSQGEQVSIGSEAAQQSDTECRFSPFI
jgi:hypothetical protein